VTDVLSASERDACAHDALAVIEVALDQLTPETRSAFWAAVDTLYRLPAQAGAQPGGAAPGPSLSIRPPA
jgi:hypothetical protein